MIVRSARPEDHFTVVANAIVTNCSLSWKARGILIYLLSKPDHWTTSSENLARQGPDGRDAIRSALTELDQAGYLKRTRSQGRDGRWRTVVTVYDTPNPQPVDNPVGNLITDDGFTDVG